MKLTKIKYSMQWLEKYKLLIYSAILFVFFPPMVLSVLEDFGFRAWKLIDYGYDGAQLVFSALGIFAWYRNPKREKSVWFMFLVAHVTLMLTACLYNGSVDFGQIRRMFCQIGFLFICAEMVKDSLKTFLRAGLAVFAIYVVWGVLTIYLFPKGFLNAETTYAAIYGLGAKNNSFPWYFALFFFVYAALVEHEKGFSLVIPVMILATIVAGLICESANTVLCMVLVLAMFFLVKYAGKFLVKFNPLYVLVAFVAAVILLYIGAGSPLMKSLLGKIGRNATFSGRDALWHQAVVYFAQNPIFGAGWDITYTLRSGTVTPHAHSQWMDKLAKFGILQAFALVGLVYTTFRRAAKHPKRLHANILAFMLLIYMLHMSFDTYNYNFFAMFIIVINNMLITDEDEKVQKKAEQLFETAYDILKYAISKLRAWVKV